MTDDALDQKEADWNVKTEIMMQKNASKLRMKWMIIPEDVCITPKYICRYCATITVAFGVLWLLFLLAIPVIGIVTVVIISYIYKGRFPVFDQAFFQVFLTPIIWAERFLAPWIVIYSLVLSAIITASLIPCAKYWNRRARRLQANPIVPGPEPLNPGVWPPPPRI